MINEYALEKLAQSKAKDMEKYFVKRDRTKSASWNVRWFNMFKIQTQQPVCCCC